MVVQALFQGYNQGSGEVDLIQSGDRLLAHSPQICPTQFSQGGGCKAVELQVNFDAWFILAQSIAKGPILSNF
jgi:hypothetical protein